jgi:hypothetical protein
MSNLRDLAEQYRKSKPAEKRKRRVDAIAQENQQEETPMIAREATREEIMRSMDRKGQRIWLGM